MAASTWIRTYLADAFRWRRGRQGTGYDKMLLLIKYFGGFSEAIPVSSCRRTVIAKLNGLHRQKRHHPQQVQMQGMPARGQPALGALLLSCTFLTYAGSPLPSTSSQQGDPFDQCEHVSTALPNSLTGLRKRGPMLSLKITENPQEHCDIERFKCRLLDVRMPGLEASLLEVTSERVISPLVIRISSKRWRLMKGVYVGQRLSELATLYGVQIPANDGAFQICGEATCLEVTHQQERVTSLRLDCQSST